jgi:pullulanase
MQFFIGAAAGTGCLLAPAMIQCIGSAGGFNDRLRDAAIGGSPFAPPELQGFLTGLHTDPNPAVPPPSSDSLQELLHSADLLRLGMAGNLQSFTLQTASGDRKSGRHVKYGPVPAAYCAQPCENVVYLGCHDNEALYDLAALKANHEGAAAVCARVVQLALGTIAISQGLAFFHAGDDLLRSKSLDRDSYNSGDWFNALLWDQSHNGFGVWATVVTHVKLQAMF